MITKSGAINLENRKLDFTDEINGRLILTALTLCTGQWGNNYEEKNWLYFGTRRCSTIRIPTAQNPKKTNEKFEIQDFAIFRQNIYCIFYLNYKSRQNVLTRWLNTI